jgi:nucleotide-binding universal stress UspA family protein
MCVFSHILILLDCSSVDDAIIDCVLKMTANGNSKVTLVRVVHSHTLDEDRTLKAQADACMRSRLKQFAAAAVDTDTLILSGEPESELGKEIKTGKYDLVALATHGHKVFSDILLGSVSDYLKHAVDTPLLMVRGNRPGLVDRS